MAFENAISIFLKSTFNEPILYGSIMILIFFIMFSWFASIFTRNYSIVDRLWSILPPLYASYFFIASFVKSNSSLSVFIESHLKLAAMTTLCVLWGMRLTYNFARKGGYSLTTEDYRWVVVIKTIDNDVIFQVFNFFFIAVYQNILLFIITLPMYLAALDAVYLPSISLELTDVIAIIGLVFFIMIETIADEQQWAFYSQRTMFRDGDARVVDWNGDLERGFFTGGLFQYSRHPNFFSEVMVWWCVFFFTLSSKLYPFAPSQVTSLQALLQWPYIAGVGAVLLTLLFQGSTTLTEFITLGKYPAYAEYQSTVSRLIPSVFSTTPKFNKQN